MKQNALNWFEIYVSDFARAKSFYEGVLGITMEGTKMEDMEMAMFPFEEGKGTGGSITHGKCGQPGAGGTIVYLDVEGELDAVLERIPGHGGKVHTGRTPIPPHGFIALFEDLEGNIVGLHSIS